MSETKELTFEDVATHNTKKVRLAEFGGRVFEYITIILRNCLKKKIGKWES